MLFSYLLLVHTYDDFSSSSCLLPLYIFLISYLVILLPSIPLIVHTFFLFHLNYVLIFSLSLHNSFWFYFIFLLLCPSILFSSFFLLLFFSLSLLHSFFFSLHYFSIAFFINIIIYYIYILVFTSFYLLSSYQHILTCTSIDLYGA